MICPQCKAEYLDGVTHCSDCDVDLVQSLPDPRGDSTGALSNAQLRSVWIGASQEECARICGQLKESAIPFRVKEHAREFLTNIGQSFEIGVPPEHFDQAKAIVGIDSSDPADEATNQSEMELPAEDDESTPAVLDGGWDPENWDPENATVEIWSGKDESQAATIESCLREVNIHARTDAIGGGPLKVLVMPDDESRAKEIAREIDQAEPPK